MKVGGGVHAEDCTLHFSLFRGEGGQLFIYLLLFFYLLLLINKLYGWGLWNTKRLLIKF